MISQKYGLGISTEIQADISVKAKPPKIKVSGNANASREKKKLGILSNLNELDDWHESNMHNINLEITKTEANPILIEIIASESAAVHLAVNVRRGARAALLVELKGNPKLMTFKAEIMAEDESHFDYYEINELSKESFIYSKRAGIAGKSSIINFVTSDNGASTLSETKAILDGDKSATRQLGLFYGKNQRYDMKQEATHNGKETSSDIKIRGVLNDAESIARGLIQINESAEASNGYQKSDVLLIGDARAVSIPDLLIHNDKVSCSHGSTITRLEDEKLFYMMSRGLTKKDAEVELLEGFFEEILKNINNTELLPRLLGTLLEKVRKDVQ